jgi:hypothetical protein
MSQPLGSPINFEGDQQNETAVDMYQQLMAKGHFRPSSSITLRAAGENAPGPEPQTYASVPTASTKTAYSQRTSFAPIAQRRAAYSSPEFSPPPTPTPQAPPRAVYPPHSTASSSSPYALFANPTYNAYGPPINLTYNTVYDPPVNPTYAAHGPQSAMPRLASSDIDPNLVSHPSYNPAHTSVFHQPTYTPESITYEMIATRVHLLLQDKLTACHMSVIATLSSTITNHLVSLGTAGKLGSCGLSSVKDIFMVVGHEGAMDYMALAVIAPVELRLLLKGPNTDLEGKDALKDPQAMEWLRQGFHNVALSEWEMIAAGMKGIRR